nr:Coenzyme F420 hydrogenase/dehydrogenase, beta subunit C-terminal domain [Butyrivibrio sp.]
MITPVLFENKKDCCACGACLNICPKQAISMHEDEYGFIYPVVDEKLCIGCGACKKDCSYQNKDETNVPLECYAAVSKNKDQAKRSASAGIFSALATKTLLNGGVVYGAAFDKAWNVNHISIGSADELYKLQGSKYTQSNTGKTFSEVKKALIEGKNVLYSGTPCQIAGLKGFLGKDYNNLLTVDIVCHGVPNNKMFKEY